MVLTIVWIALAAILAYLAVFFLTYFFGRPLFIRNVFSRAMLKFLFKSPETLTMLGMLDGFGIHGHNGKWSDQSYARQRELLSDLAKDLRHLRSFNRSRLSEKWGICYDQFEWFGEDQLNGEKYIYHGFPITQMFGLHTQIPDMLSGMQPLDCRANVENFIKRVKGVGAVFARQIENMKEAEGALVLPPRFALEKAIEQMKSIAGTPAAESAIYKAFTTKISKLKLPQEYKDSSARRLVEAIESDLHPAYRTLIAFCEGQLSRCTSNDGAWRLPDGEAYYRATLASSTTIDTSPEDIHATGLRETGRIEGEIAGLLDKLSVDAAPTIGARIAKLKQDERFYYPQSEDGRKAILADFKKIIDDMYERLPEAFEKLPKTRVEVEAIPAAQEKDAPGGYYQPGTLDGKRPGRFFVNLYNMKDNPKYGMKTLCYHETVPGHHLQLSLQFEMKGMPLFMRVVPTTAYVEGWALYSERLAREMGFYANDDLGLLGSLLAEHFRAVRLVVDTGLHAMRWSREKAIDYMRDHTGEENVAEVERYIVMPGQACSYKVGELAIRDIRAKAEKELGASFDLRRFHTMLLSAGALPLGILTKRADAWISSEKSRAA
jgi:uncharacterized protein (DUF885 family)